MCGFAGFVDFSGRSGQPALADMIKPIAHRGPDDEGCQVMHSGDASIGFGFRRLSIIDLTETGHQPMTDAFSGNVIVYNGEVYNYRELRSELEKFGHKFIGTSDTEVILKSYSQWGIAAIRRFNGMFAMAVYDREHDKIIFIRDRAGVKPLYYYWKDGLFLFGSELKSFHRHPGFKKELHYDAAALFFGHGYINAPHTIFRHTHKLPPGHTLTLNLKTGEMDCSTYWNVLDALRDPLTDIGFDEAVTELERLLVSAFRYRMIADVPVGVFLSGGYDSSCVAALLQAHSGQKLKTFTIGFSDGAFDESPHARAVSKHLGTDHYEYECTSGDALDLIPGFYDVFDEPFSEAVAVPNLLVSKLARREVKVALSADGGDELFAGYSRHHYTLNRIRQMHRLPGPLRRAGAMALKKLIFNKANRPLETGDRHGRQLGMALATGPVMMFQSLNQVFTGAEINAFMARPFNRLASAFLDEPYRGHDALNQILAAEIQSYLAGDILHKVDMTSMHAGLEAREPLLDYRVMEFAARLPSNLKLRGQTGKLPIRHIVHKYIPEKLVNRPKQGFGIPMAGWGMKELKPLFDPLFDETRLKQQGLFNPAMVSRFYRYYVNGHPGVFDRIWMFITFQLWHQKWMQ